MTLKKNISSGNKSTNLLSIFQRYFSSKFNLARIKFIYLLISSLCKVKTVNFQKLSIGFDNKAVTSSNYRRIQRFLADVVLPMKWIAQLIFSLLPEKNNLILVMDRTNWKLGGKDINILMLGISYKNIAFPLMFKMLDKRGNSNTAERIALINDFISWFGSDCIDCLLADREFVGKEWIAFLNDNGIAYHIRIRENFMVFDPKKQVLAKAWHYFNNLKIGELRHFHRIMVINDEYCYISGMKTIKDNKIEFCIVISFNKPEESLEKYAKRWQIETLFKAFKSSGFNLEDTHVTQMDRIEKLVLLVMLAFVWCYKIGDYIDTNIKAIRIMKHGNRAISIFKYGLDYLSRILISGNNYLKINVYQFLSCSYSLSFNCLPKMVSRYFCNLLLGLSGIVISINPCSNAGFKYFARKCSL